MKITKKIDVEIEINGKYCGSSCPYLHYLCGQLEPTCHLRCKSFPLYLNDVGSIKELVTRSSECIKEFGYGEKK